MASYPPPPGYGGPPPGYGGAPPPPGYGAPPPYGPMRSTNGKAIAALVCGIVAFATCMTPVGLAAVILAPQAKREIRAQPDRYDGEGMAQAGLILGWIAVALTVLGVALFVVLLIVGATADSTYDYESLAALGA